MLRHPFKSLGGWKWEDAAPGVDARLLQRHGEPVFGRFAEGGFARPVGCRVMRRRGVVGVDDVQVTAQSVGEVVCQAQERRVGLVAGDAADDRAHAFGVERSDGLGRNDNHRTWSPVHERAGNVAEQIRAGAGVAPCADDDQFGVLPVVEDHQGVGRVAELHTYPGALGEGVLVGDRPEARSGPARSPEPQVAEETAGTDHMDQRRTRAQVACQAGRDRGGVPAAGRSVDAAHDAAGNGPPSVSAQVSAVTLGRAMGAFTHSGLGVPPIAGARGRWYERATRRMTSLKTRILLADDHAVVRRGLRFVLDAQPDLEVVAEAGDGAEAVELAYAADVQLAVLDVAMPRMTGLQAAAALTQRHPTLRVLMLSMYDSEQYLYEALRAGASGYVLKTAADRDLVEACRAAIRGEPFLYPAAITALIRDYLDRARTGDEGPADPLTPRELEVLKLIAEAYTSDRIAHELSISRRTVDRHRENILAKLGMRDRVELTRYAIRRGLIEP